VDVSFSEEEGEIFGFIGPNGAGIHHHPPALSLIHPPAAAPRSLARTCHPRPEIRRDIGYLPSEVFYYEGMKVIDLSSIPPVFTEKTAPSACTNCPN